MEAQVPFVGRRLPWRACPVWKAGEIPGEDPGFGCAGEGDGTGRWARTVSGLGQRATLAGGTGGSGRTTRGAGERAAARAGVRGWARGRWVLAMGRAGPERCAGEGGNGPQEREKETWAGPGVWALVWAARKGLDWVLVCWALGLGFLSFFYSLFFSFSKYISNKV